MASSAELAESKTGKSNRKLSAAAISEFGKGRSAGGLPRKLSLQSSQRNRESPNGS
jgi:hypothetical protein